MLITAEDVPTVSLTEIKDGAMLEGITRPVRNVHLYGQNVDYELLVLVGHGRCGK